MSTCSKLNPRLKLKFYFTKQKTIIYLFLGVYVYANMGIHLFILNMYKRLICQE